MRLPLKNETKRIVLMLLSIFAIPVFVSTLVMTYFWGTVLNKRPAYEMAEFEVREIAHVRFSSKTRIRVAQGRINGAEETLYDWADYFSESPQEGAGAGKRLPVMYNHRASDFSYSGRNLRVLSLKQFKNAHKQFYQSLMFSALPPLIWLVYFRFKKKSAPNLQKSWG